MSTASQNGQHPVQVEATVLETFFFQSQKTRQSQDMSTGEESVAADQFWGKTPLLQKQQDSTHDADGKRDRKWMAGYGNTLLLYLPPDEISWNKTPSADSPRVLNQVRILCLYVDGESSKAPQLVDGKTGFGASIHKTSSS